MLHCKKGHRVSAWQKMMGNCPKCTVEKEAADRKTRDLVSRSYSVSPRPTGLRPDIRQSPPAFSNDDPSPSLLDSTNPLTSFGSSFDFSSSSDASPSIDSSSSTDYGSSDSSSSDFGGGGGFSGGGGGSDW